MGDNKEYVDHEDEYPNDPNAQHGVNTEDEKLEADDGLDHDSA